MGGEFLELFTCNFGYGVGASRSSAAGLDGALALLVERIGAAFCSTRSGDGRALALLVDLITRAPSFGGGGDLIGTVAAADAAAATAFAFAEGGSRAVSGGRGLPRIPEEVAPLPVFSFVAARFQRLLAFSHALR